MAIAKPPATSTPPDNVEDCASPVAPRVARPDTDSVDPSDTPPVAVTFAPTYTLLAMASPPEIITPEEAVEDEASPDAPRVVTPLTNKVEPRLAAPNRLLDPAQIKENSRTKRNKAHHSAPK